MKQEQIDYRKNYKSFIGIINDIKNNKAFNKHSNVLYTDFPELVEIILSGYPLKSLVATENVDGQLTFNSLVLSVLKNMYDSTEFTTSTKAYLESIQFEYLYFFEKNDFDLSKFYKY